MSRLNAVIIVAALLVALAAPAFASPIDAPPQAPVTGAVMPSVADFTVQAKPEFERYNPWSGFAWDYVNLGGWHILDRSKTAIQQVVPSILQRFNQLVVYLSAYLMFASFHWDFVNEAAGKLGSGVLSLRDALYAPFLALLLIFLVGWVVWQAIVRWKTTKALSGVVMMALVFAFGYYFTQNAEALIVKAGEVSDGVSMGFMRATAAPLEVMLGRHFANNDEIVAAVADHVWGALARAPCEDRRRLVRHRRRRARGGSGVLC